VRQVHPAQSAGQVARVQQAHLRQLAQQRFAQRARKHRHPVLAALAIADGQLVALQVHVLDPQPRALHQAQPAAVEQPGHQRLPPGQALQQPHHLRARQHHRQPPRPLGTDHVLHPRQLDAQHLPIEEEQGGQRLVLGAGGHVVPRRQPGEKRLHRRPVQFRRMPRQPRPDIPADPVQIRLLRAQAVVLQAQTPPHLVQQPGRPVPCYTP